MTEDAKLSDFASASETGDEPSEPTEIDESDEPAPRDESDATAENPADDGTTIDGPTSLSTYAWGEHSCARCGAETDRVWRDDGAFVCADCKAW